MTWRDHARMVLHDLHLSRDDPDWKQKLFDAYPFGERRYLPYKVWCEEVRRVYPWARKPKKLRKVPMTKAQERFLFGGDE